MFKDNEIWRDIKGYENLYKVSNQGNVKSLIHKNQKILKLTKTKSGYLRVTLFKNEERKSFLVHRLIAETFIPNPENKPCVDHINTIRDDNRVENLRWVTHKENNNNELSLKHFKNKIISKETRIKMSESTKKRFENKENHPHFGIHRSEEVKKKISDTHKNKYCKEKTSNYGKYGANSSNHRSVYCIELDKSWNCIKDCADELGLYPQNIIKVCKNIRKTCGNYHFKYI